MKIWTSEHVFSHPWETVVQATWRKYPNPMNPSVIGLDVVDRKVTDKGVLKSHRLMTTEWPLPGWIAKMCGITETCFISEHSEVDARQKTMTLRSRNVTLANLMSVDESLVYCQHPDNPEQTVLKQEATINIQGVPMTDYLEGLVKGTCQSKAQNGRQALEWVIAKIKDEALDLKHVAQKEFDSLANELKPMKKAAQKELDSIANEFKPMTSSS